MDERGCKMSENKNVKHTPEKRREIGRINNEKDPENARLTPPAEKEIGVENNEIPVTGPMPPREIGRMNNQNPREQKPEEPEIGVTHNDPDKVKKSGRKGPKDHSA
jgi:general stress protein YciG